MLSGHDGEVGETASLVPPRRFTLRKVGRLSRTYVLAAGNPPVGQLAVFHKGALWQPDTADVPGDTWVFGPAGVFGLWGLRTTIVSRRTGQPIAYRRFRDLVVVGGPRLRYHPRGLRPAPPRWVREDGVVVATFSRTKTVDVMSGNHQLDVLCALASSRWLLGDTGTRLPPSSV